MSPGKQRILDRLQQSDAEAKVLAIDCFLPTRRTTEALLTLNALGLIHIASWRRCTLGGYPAKVWRYGQGVNAEKPVAYPKALRDKLSKEKRIRELAPVVGLSIAKRMFQARSNYGVERVVIGGKVFYERKSRGQNIKG